MLLLHTWGGVASGLGLLFLLPVGGLAFLLTPRSALFLAAVAAIAVLADTIWQQLTGHTDITLLCNRRPLRDSVVHDRGIRELRRRPHARE